MRITPIKEIEPAMGKDRSRKPKQLGGRYYEQYGSFPSGAQQGLYRYEQPPFTQTENTEPSTLADYIQGILSRKAQTGKPGYSQSLYNLKDAAKMLNFLQTNNIMDMAGLDEKFKSMIGEQLDIQGKLKPVERRLGTLKKHLEQADIYFKCKGKKPLTEAEQILFTTAKDYLKGVMNGKTTIPTKAWKEEYTKLTAERKTLNQRYLALKEEVKEAEKIRKNVYGILRQEQREQQTQRKQDMER